MKSTTQKQSKYLNVTKRQFKTSTMPPIRLERKELG
jgi:hypothetical protein